MIREKGIGWLDLDLDFRFGFSIDVWMCGCVCVCVCVCIYKGEKNYTPYIIKKGWGGA